MSKKYIVVLLALVFTSSAAFGAALDNTHMGVRAFGMGKAFTGLADDASAVFYNPAGLAQGKDGLDIQGYGLFIATDLTFEHASAGENKSDEKFLIPGFFLKYKKGKVGLGLGLYVPYGGSSYKYTSLASPLTAGNQPTIEQSLSLMAFGGSVGVQLSTKFNIGISLTGYLGQYSQKTITNSIVAQEDDISGVAAVSGNIGMLYSPSEKLSIGFTVKLPVRITVDGTRENINGMFSGDLSGELRFPFYFTLGAAFRPNNKLTVTFDVNYATYSTMSDITLTYSGTTLGTNILDMKTGYKDAMYFALGAEFKMNKMITVRGGVTLTPHATEDNGLQLSCDVTHIVYSLGATVNFTEGFGFNIGLQYLMGFEREVDSSSALTATSGSLGGTPLSQTFNKNAFLVMSGLTLKL